MKAKVTIPVMKLQPTQQEPRSFQNRRFRINRNDFQVIGFTPLCPGCKALIRGSPPVNHSELCRTRVERELVRLGDVRVSAHRRVHFENDSDKSSHKTPREAEEQDERDVKKRRQESEKDVKCS